jgi:outer membrane receptor protein involved in Fe transport
VKSPIPITFFAAWLVAGPATYAQTASAPAKDEAVTLSPFEVRTDRDTGFVAASSLAGGRLASDLKDTPVAYSVLTREFIDALGLDDLGKAIEWTVGGEARVEAGADAIFAAVPTLNVRGVAGLSRQRNFFPFSVNFDSYNLDRFDFARGPNAVLYGNGSIGGLANTVTKQAVFGKPVREVELRAGSWSNYRVSTDVGQSKDNLAVRVNTLWQDSKDWALDDYTKKKSAFMTSTYRLAENTTIRLDTEYGTLEQRRAQTYISDKISGWDGTTTFATVPTAVIPVATRNAAGVVQFGTDVWVASQAFGTNDILSFTNNVITQPANGVGTFAGGVPIVGGAISTNGQPLLYQLNLPANRFDRAIAGSSFRVPDRAYRNRFTNRPVFKQRFRDFTLFFNHQVGKSLFLELAADFNRQDRLGDTTYNRGIQDLYIDVNRQLPNGVTNPNFLKPFFQVNQYRPLNTGSETLNLRLAAAYVKDTKIGKFTLSFLGGSNRTKSYSRAYQLTLPFESDARLWVGRHFVSFRQYMDQADRSMPEYRSAVNVVDPISGVTRSMTPVMVLDSTRPDSVNNSKNEFTNGNLAMQAKLFEGKLILLGAYRRDKYTNSGERAVFAGDNPVGWNGYDTFMRPKAPADYFTLPRVIARDASGNPTGGTIAADVRPRAATFFGAPQYSKDRFRDDFSPPNVNGNVGTKTAGGVYNVSRWLGVTANYAETFNPPSATQRYDGSMLPPTVATGIDAGIRVNLLGGRFSGNLNYFKTHEDNSPVGPPAGSSTNFNTIYQANAIGDLSANGRNIRGFGDLPLVINDFQRRNTSGVELDITANLTNRWRLLLNGSASKPVADKAFPDTAAYYAANEKNFIQILNDTGVIVNPATKVATVDSTVPSDIASPNAIAAANAWNDIQSTYIANVVDKPRLIAGASRVTANIFTDYTLKEGPLNGVRLGIGVNYRDMEVLGFRGGDTIVSPTNPAVAIDDPKVGPYDPVYRKAYYSGTATVAYTWKLAKGRSVAFNLRIDNLFGDDQVRYSQNVGSGTGGTAQRPPNGDLSSPARVATPTAYAYPIPRSWMLSARVNF